LIHITFLIEKRQNFPSALLAIFDNKGMRRFWDISNENEEELEDTRDEWNSELNPPESIYLPHWQLAS